MRHKLHVLIGHSDSVNAAIFSNDRTLLISASDDKMVCVWNPSMGILLDRLIHHDSVNSVAFIPDNSQFASASDDGNICIWNLKEQVLMHVD